MNILYHRNPQKRGLQDPCHLAWQHWYSLEHLHARIYIDRRIDTRLLGIPCIGGRQRRCSFRQRCLSPA